MMRPGPLDQPMPPERFGELLRQRAGRPAPPALYPVPRREPAAVTDPFAREMLDEAADRALESGELLLVSEDATLADLEAAAVRVAPAADAPAVADDAMLAALGSPCLMSPRLFAVFGWQPPLAERSLMLAAALRAGATVTVAMLVGHIETYPERVEHLMRLRRLREEAGPNGGALVLSVVEAAPQDLPTGDARLPEILASARPTDPDTDRRHAIALARLALGPGVVVAD